MPCPGKFVKVPDGHGRQPVPVTVQADVIYVPEGHWLVQREQYAALIEEEYVRPD